MTLEEEKQIYSTLYEEAREIVFKSNVCDHKNGMCSRERDKQSRGIKINKYCCCGDPLGKPSNDIHCKYLLETGCSVKNLDCMLWLCKHADEKLKKEFPCDWVKLQIIKQNANPKFLKERELVF